MLLKSMFSQYIISVIKTIYKENVTPLTSDYISSLPFALSVFFFSSLVSGAVTLLEKMLLPGIPGLWKYPEAAMFLQC